MPPCQSIDKTEGSDGVASLTDTSSDGNVSDAVSPVSSWSVDEKKKEPSSSSSFPSGEISTDDYAKKLSLSSPLEDTFHWEILLFTLSVLGSIYYLMPASPSIYRKVMQVVFGLIALDAAKYYYAKGALAGVPYTPPMVSIIAMLFHPVRFWAELGRIAMKSKDGMCTDILAGNFMVFVTNPKLCRQIFVGEGTFQIFAHPNAHWLFGRKNLIYMPKEQHKRFRQMMSPALFSAEALTRYYSNHLRVLNVYMDKYAKECQDTGKPIDTRIAFRSMSAAASQESFLGPYLTDEVRKAFEEDIVTFTLGFLSFPCPWFGGLRKAIQAKNRIEHEICKMVPKSRQYIVEGKNKPRCMLDHWIYEIHNNAEETGVNFFEAQGLDDEDMARSILDFLFAAQDATNSALVYCTDVLDVRRDVLQKVQEEVRTLFDKDVVEVDDITFQQLLGDSTKIPYTSRVSNQMLHHKPPVPMVPQLVLKDTTLAGHFIPKGTVVIPSITYSSRMSGGTLHFDPDRSDSDSQFLHTMTFGGGQHKCPGRRYAEALVTAFVATLCTKYGFSRVGERPELDEFIYYPTLFPKENMFMITKLEQGEGPKQ